MLSQRSRKRLGDYELVRLLARGGMAEVYEARRVGPHGFSKQVAIKRVLPQLASDERLLDMFCDEARIQAGLIHPNLVQVVDFDEADGEPFMVLEYVEGLSLAQLIDGVAARKRTVALGPALRIAREVLSGLAFAHEACDEEGRFLGIVHRDIAPGNILVGRSGEVKLADFGIVRSAYTPARTSPGELKGKVGYVSPEQAMGVPLDVRSDLFSVGVVLAEMLVARPLFPGRNDFEVLHRLHSGDLRVLEVHGRHIPADVMGILRRALARSPGDRFESAREMVSAIDAVIARHGWAIGAHGLTEWLSDLGMIRLRTTVRPTGERAGREDPTLPRAPQPAELSYRIRRPGGTVVGPFGVSRLIAMIATGRVGEDTLVSRNGGPFLPARSLIELARVAARPAFRFFDGLGSNQGERRLVDRRSLPSQLFRFAIERRTGLLQANLGRERRRFYLKEGSPVLSSSTNPAELLGALLVQDGVATEKQVEQAVVTSLEKKRRLGEMLVAAGVLRPSQLLGALAKQRHLRLLGLCRASNAELCFVERAVGGDEATGLSGAPARLYARAVMEGYPPAEIAQLLGPLHDSRLRPTRYAQRIVDELALPDAEREALGAALGGEPVRELIGARGPAALRALLVGLCAGALATRASQ